MIGPGGDNNMPVKDEEPIIKPFKKKTRGTRGGKKNREKKLRAQMKMQLQEKPIKFIRSKTDDSVKVGIHYTVEEIILLRSLMTSKDPPSHVSRIERESKNCPAVEIFPVVFLPEDGSSPKKGELTEQKLMDKIDDICAEILESESIKQYKVHGIEPHWANSRFKNKNEPRTNSSCSSNLSTPRGDSGCPSSNMTTPREDEVTEEVKPTVPEVPNPTEIKVDENEEKKIIETATQSPTKHPMRPAKNSSNSYRSKPKFTFDQPESPYVYGMPYTWYDPMQTMLPLMPIDPRFYKQPLYTPFVYMPYSSPPLLSHTPSPVSSRRASST